MFKLNEPLKINTKDGNIDVLELEITKEKLTAEIIIRAEREFLANSGIYPTTGMEDSKDYIAYIIAKMCGYKYEDIIKINGVDFVKISKIVRGFFGRSELEEMLAKVSEELSGSLERK